MAEKSKVAAALLCFFLGYLGIHRFYLGKVGTGVIQLLLCIVASALLIVGIGIIFYVILGVWVLIDFILILTGNLKAKVSA
jgi:TM2 domain-containing membrane protein YozV